MKLRLPIIILAAALSLQCTEKRDIIQENIENAKAQLAYLIEASGLEIHSEFLLHSSTVKSNSCLQTIG